MGKKIAALVIVYMLVSMGWTPLTGADGENDGSSVGRHHRERFVLALVPEKNVFEQRRQYQYITDYLSQQLNLDIYLDIMPSYGDICNAFLSHNADAGIFGSFIYILTQAKVEIEPLARPEWENGSSSYSGLIFTRRDSDITRIEDMRGRSLVMVDKATIAGYVYQMYYFKSFGIENMEDYFSKIYFAGSHDAAAWAVYIGEADIGAAKDQIFNDLAKEYPDFKEKMIILAKSQNVPSNAFAVRNDLNPVLKERLRSLLLNLDKTEEGRDILKKFGAEKFTATSNEDYDPVYRMVEKLGIDLSVYPCQD